jgi:hypothetical protein
VLGVVGIVSFIFVEIRMKDEALIPMRLFRKRMFAQGLVVNVLIGLAMFGAIATLPAWCRSMLELPTLPITDRVISRPVTRTTLAGLRWALTPVSS